MQIKTILFPISALALLTATLSFAGQQTWSGEISDSMCGGNHQAMAQNGRKVNPRDCTLECVKSGQKYVFVSSGQVYEIAIQDLPALQQHAGHMVQLTGDLSSDHKTITVAKVQMSH